MLTNGLPQALSSIARNIGWIALASSPSASASAGGSATNETIVAYGSELYFPVSRDVQSLLSLDTANEEEVDAAFAGPPSGQVRQRRYDAHTPAGLQQFFHHHARGSVVGIATESRDELMRLSRGEITIAAGDTALHAVVRTIPAGTLQKVEKPFKGWYIRRPPAIVRSVYPAVTSGRAIASVTHLQPDGSRSPVLVAMHQNRHSYSVDNGNSWTPTGAIHDPAAQDARARAWSQFFGNRAARARALQSQASQGHGG